MFLLVQNGRVAKYPYTVTQFRADNPSVSLPASPTDAQLAEVGIWRVLPSGLPAASMGTVVEEGEPTQISGQWTQVWVTRAAAPDELTQQQKTLIDGIVSATQQRLDDFAKTRNYDGILSLCTYATSAVPKFQAEGQYGVNARDQTWATLYQILDEVQAGTSPVPTGFAGIEPLLPALNWPA